MPKYSKSNDILPALKSEVSLLCKDDISVSNHPRNKLRGVHENCYNKRSGVVWKKAPDVSKNVKLLKTSLNLEWVNLKRVFCCRSFGTKTRAVARIWGLGKIWQLALTLQPSYILEVVSEKFDRLSPDEQNNILLHELSHIPKNFSGALVPHYRKGKRNFNSLVKTLIQQYNLKK